VAKWTDELNSALSDFAQVAALAHVVLPVCVPRTEVLPAPHCPPTTLPHGHQAVYCFAYGDTWLKVGKVGPKSSARYCSQHYNPASSRSNLAASLLSDATMVASPVLTADNVRAWICANTNRANVLVPSSLGPAVLSLLEAFLQARLAPLYEG